MKFVSLISLILTLVLSSFAISVYDVQFSETGPSPLDGEIVEVSGVVTATNFDGDKYFISDIEGGQWRGIYVFDFDNTVAEGDFITITAEVDEYYDLTELKSVSEFSIDGTETVPDPFATTCHEASGSEALEGVLITIPDVTVSEVDTFGNFYVNDGTGNLKIGNDFDFIYSPSVGDVIESITGVMFYEWDEFVLMPRYDADIVTDFTPEFVEIYDIQYSTDGVSPYFEEVVTVNGIVSAIGYSGSSYFICDNSSEAWGGL